MRLSIATLLSQHHKVYDVDIIHSKVELVNQCKSPIQDNYIDIEKYLDEKDLNLTAVFDAEKADFVVIAAPTNVYSLNFVLIRWNRAVGQLNTELCFVF